MASHKILINSSGDAQPSTLQCRAGDKITWENNYTVALNAFSLPSCVAPQTTPAPLAVGATTRSFTVNSDARGSYGYSFGWPSLTGDTRGGTIDVS